MCDCIDLTDAEFARRENPTRIDAGIFLDGRPVRAVVATCIPFWVTKKRGQKPSRLIATYCPFCGEMYPESGS